MKRTHFSELPISRSSRLFNVHKKSPFLIYVLFIKVSGQITRDTLWKQGEVFLLRIWRIFLFLRAVVNIPIQTLIIPPWARWSSHSWSLGCLWSNLPFEKARYSSSWIKSKIKFLKQECFEGRFKRWRDVLFLTESGRLSHYISAERAKAR